MSSGGRPFPQRLLGAFGPLRTLGLYASNDRSQTEPNMSLLHLRWDVDFRFLIKSLSFDPRFLADDRNVLTA